MREFKFRICYTDRIGGKYVIYHDKERPFSHFILLNGDIVEDYGKAVYEIPFDCAEPAFLQQYTGMNDINGKEIYQGDIILIGDRKREVLFEIGQFYIDEGNREDVLINEIDNICEVIGNIFENPDLLKS